MESENKSMELAMGIYDSPQTQEQPIFYIDNRISNIAVFGGPMSGKTTFIKTFLVRLFEKRNEKPFEDVYIIDFGGNLGSYGKLLNVCAFFDNSNEENIKRVFKVIENRLDANAKQLGSQSFYSFAEKNPEKCPAHMTLIIENINAFLADERYASYQDTLMQFCRDGLSKGLSVIMTANDTTGTGRLLANFGQKIAFEMPADSYYEIFNTKTNKPMRIPGRCVVSKESATYECQIFFPFDDLDDEKKVESLIQAQDDRMNPNRILSFPDILTQSNISDYCSKDKLDSLLQQEVLIGLDYYDHAPVKVNILENRSIAIYGKRKFGKTNLLTGILNRIYETNKTNVRFVFLEDGRNEIKDLYEKYKDQSFRFFNYNTVDFIGFLMKNGYVTKKFAFESAQNAVKPSEAIKDNPFTVFILQAKTFYQKSKESSTLLGWFADDMIGRAEQQNYMFIFSDVKNIIDTDMRAKFNNMLSSAFVLDNIGEFVADRGNKSVFSEMEAKELKSEYAKCSIGDGYYYDIETDTLQKLRFIKHI